MATKTKAKSPTKKTTTKTTKKAAPKKATKKVVKNQDFYLGRQGDSNLDRCDSISSIDLAMKSHDALDDIFGSWQLNSCHSWVVLEDVNFDWLCNR